VQLQRWWAVCAVSRAGNCTEDKQNMQKTVGKGFRRGFQAGEMGKPGEISK
jgi:hypothetical protein